MDWTGCAVVERDPLKLGGVPILKNTRMQADAVVENFAHGMSAEEISDDFNLDLSTVKAVLAFAAHREVDLAS